MLAMLMSHSVWIHVYSKEIPTPADTDADVGPFFSSDTIQENLSDICDLCFRGCCNGQTLTQNWEENIHKTYTRRCYCHPCFKIPTKQVLIGSGFSVQWIP